MLQAFWEVAPPGTWAVLSLASIFLMAGFVLLSHTLLRKQAYGDTFGGPAHPGRLEWTMRVGTACLAIGGALWAYQMSAPLWVLVALGGTAVIGLGLEAAAFARR